MGECLLNIMLEILLKVCNQERWDTAMFTRGRYPLGGLVALKSPIFRPSPTAERSHRSELDTFHLC